MYKIFNRYKKWINIKSRKLYSTKIFKKNRVKYRLIGIISHFGSSGFGGHNIFFGCRSNKWYEFNDSIVSDIDFDEIPFFAMSCPHFTLDWGKKQ